MVTLGRFHAVLNLLGAISTIMKNTGLSNVLETIYKENSVLHILKRETVSQALRVHFAINQCLFIRQDITLKSELDNVYSSFKNKEINIEDVDANNTLQFLRANLKNQLQNLTTASRTASLWLSYQYLLELARNVIRADRLGILQLHLETGLNLLPVLLLHATIITLRLLIYTCKICIV